MALVILGTLFLSQRFWYRSIWRVTANWRTVWLRVTVRLIYISLLILTIGTAIDGLRMGHRPHLVPSKNAIEMFVGLWLISALFAYLALKLVRGVERLWASVRSAARRSSVPQRDVRFCRRASRLPRHPRRNSHRQSASRSRRYENRPA